MGYMVEGGLAISRGSLSTTLNPKPTIDLGFEILRIVGFGFQCFGFGFRSLGLRVAVTLYACVCEICCLTFGVA